VGAGASLVVVDDVLIGTSPRTSVFVPPQAEASSTPIIPRAASRCMHLFLPPGGKKLVD
jgi:hypothetical protein